MTGTIQILSIFAIGTLTFFYIEFHDNAVSRFFRNDQSQTSKPDKSVSASTIQKQIDELKNQIQTFSKDEKIETKAQMKGIVDAQTELRGAVREMEMMLTVFQKQIDEQSKNHTEPTHFKKSA